MLSLRPLSYHLQTCGPQFPQLLCPAFFLMFERGSTGVLNVKLTVSETWAASPNLCFCDLGQKCACVRECMYAYLCAGTPRGQRCWILLELELQVVVSHPVWVLGTTLESSVQAICALNC